MMLERNKVIHEVEKSGNLYFLINAFIGAYNRRTDVMAQPAADQKTVDQLTKQVASLEQALQTAINNQSPKEK